MESYALLAPLVILFPAIGAFINLFFGARMTERWVAGVAIGAAVLSFLVTVLLFSGLSANPGGVIVNPPFFDGWLTIPSAGIDFSWQLRVDTLSVAMLLFITGVGSLIHIYAVGYMHGDPRFHRFFTYLNMFLAFMVVLVTGNNFLMMFVGWEGVGLCSFLLIGFWFDRTRGVGWRNSNAARKAMIVNRIGDFGLLMAMFMIFGTFGTLDYFTPGEIANVELVEEHAAEEHGEEAPGAAGTEGEGEGEGEGAAGEGTIVLVQGEGEAGGEGAEGEGEEGEGGHGHEESAVVYTNNDHIPTEFLGVFGQTERMLEEGHEVQWGPVRLPIQDALILITLFIVIGVTGKSAQIPLLVWLPDAMAGPTPVSALIHAATMVTAGVYLMVRSNVFFYEAELTSFIVTLIGVGTALVGGFIALGQWDIKRVLAYSTVSQLGFMVAAVGIGAYSAAMFHLITHAFFKALLFLGSGSVIHAMEHGHAHGAHHNGHADDHADAHADQDAHTDHADDEDFDPQDMRNMGGLRARMPITYWTYIFGTLALAGIFPFAGFWSKDEILADSWIAGLTAGGLTSLGGFIALVGLLIAAGFTAFYMWRQIIMVFHGQPRTDAARNAPESVRTMTYPLIVLAACSLLIGFINVPDIFLFNSIFIPHELTHWLENSVLHAHAAEFQLLIAMLALGLAVGAIVLASRIYGERPLIEGEGAEEGTLQDPLVEIPRVGRPWGLAHARLYIDEIYYRLVERPFNVTARFLADVIDWQFLHDYFHDVVIVRGFNGIGQLLARPVDLGIIDGAVNGVGVVARWLGGLLKPIQTGYVRTYAITLLLGVVIVIIVLLLPLIQNGG
ncbi:MAG: hypothetical protein GYB67_01015 [Chloroflexi bacterium]|nr:hypothetical protein [Chloroflexota bacterium]